MAKTRRAHSLWPQVCQGPTPHAGTSTPGPNSAASPASSVAGASSVVAAGAGLSVPAARPSTAAAASPAPAAVQGTAAANAEGFSSVAPTQRRYHTRVSPTPPAPLHPRLAWRAPPPKRTRTSGPGESSTLRPQAPPSPPYQGIVGAPDLSPASIIRWPYFPCDPIPENVVCKGRDFHGEV